MRALPGVERAELNYGTARLSVWGDVAAHQIVLEADRAGYQARPLGRSFSRRSRWRRSSRLWYTLIAGLLTAIGIAVPYVQAHLVPFPIPSWTSELFFLLAVVFGGYNPFRSAVFTALERRIDMNVLMSVAALGAFAIGERFEAAAIIFLFSLADNLVALSLDRARRPIADLLELAPGVATVARESGEVEVPVDELAAGDVCVVHPGARIPVDGTVVWGESWVDESPVTGESLPVEKRPGDPVYAGSSNHEGLIRIEVKQPAEESELARIVRLVEEAGQRKTPVERFVDRFARGYTPVVMIAALLVTAVPPVAFGEPLHAWAYRGLALLVLSCPCALLIAVPAAVLSALAHATRSGVLVKGGAHIEALANVDTVVFDKTGTLTHGRLEVTEIVPWGRFSQAEVMAAAAGVEWDSEHPVGRAIVRRAQEMEIERLYVQSFKAQSGLGALGSAGGVTYRVGSARFMSSKGLSLFALKNEIRRLEDEGKTVVVVARELEVMGLIALSDTVRVESRRVVRRLKHMGRIKTVCMITGDNKGTAAVLAREIGIDEFKAELLPDQKVSAIREWQRQGRRVAMVGDGVNDAPALAQADVGIAMGVRAPSAATAAADVALLSDDLAKLPYAIALARRTMRVIRQNAMLALGVKAAALALLAAGDLELWMAIASDAGASLLVTLNGVRLLRRVKVSQKGRRRSAAAVPAGS